MGAIEAAGMAAALVADAEIVLSPPLLVAPNQSESGAPRTPAASSRPLGHVGKSVTCFGDCWPPQTSASLAGAIVHFATAALATIW